MRVESTQEVLSAAGAAVADGSTVDGQFVRRHVDGLRAELLAGALANRERVSGIADPSLRHVAIFEWGRIVEKLTSSGPYRLLREELPAGYRKQHRGANGDLLVLSGSDELRAA